MKALIKHCWENNQEEILKRSVANCHCQGVDSIMLSESKGRTIRLFHAGSEHQLQTNCPDFMRFGLTVGFHPHHCNITLAPVFGVISNWRVTESKTGMPVRAFRWDSKLLGGRGAFTHELDTFVAHVGLDVVGEGQSVHMQGRELHTVSVNPDERAAWLVFEGKEDPNYQPLCFSNMPLHNACLDGMYTSLDRDSIAEILIRCGLKL